jgi:ferrous iron transport protein B
MIFMLVGTPCMATVAVVRRESGSWKWAWGQFFGLTVLAYVLAATAYWLGGLV